MSSEMSSAVKLHPVQVQSLPQSSRSNVASQPSGKESNLQDSSVVVSASNPAGPETGNSLPQSGESLPQVQASDPANKDVATLKNQEKDKQADKNDLMAVVRNLEDIAQNTRRELKFSVDEDTERVVIKVLDSESQEVIRQIPAEEVLELARRAEQRNDNKGQLLRLEV